MPTQDQERERTRLQRLHDSLTRVKRVARPVLREIVRPVAGSRSPEERLRSERDFSDAVLDSLPGILYLYDRQGRFLRWNRQFETVTGLTSEQVSAIHPLDLFEGTDRELVAARIEEVFERGASSVEAEMICQGGQRIPHYFTGRTLEIEGETCLVGVGIDISERRRAERARLETEARYRALFDRAPDGILLADGEGFYLDANASMGALLGYDREELVGKSGADIVSSEEVPRIQPTIDEIRSGADYHREWRFRRRDGTTFPAEVIATTMPDGTIMGMVRDITERKQAEAALLELNANLERRVAERTAELEAARVRAEAADRLKSSFLATMSHELRTPLNSIIGFTGIVLQGLAGPLTEEQSKQLAMVKLSARRLLDLINDILDLSRIEAGQLRVTEAPFAMREALELTMSTVEPLARKKGLTLLLETQDLDPMIGDRRRVEQILLNLLNNAIKFTEQGGVSLRAEMTDVTAPRSHVRISVQDTGIGIGPEDMESLFQPFRQLDTGLSRQREGTGLGLVICRRLVELLGGTLTVASERGAGSTFTAILPVEPTRRSP